MNLYVLHYIPEWLGPPETSELQDKTSTYLYVLRQTWYILVYTKIYLYNHVILVYTGIY
jgi:hypothetical protein